MRVDHNGDQPEDVFTAFVLERTDHGAPFIVSAGRSEYLQATVL